MTEPDTTGHPDAKLYVVGIGASAGGLEALRPLVAGLRANGRMCYIVAQHLSPDHKSLMVDLLGRETSLQVQEARHNTSLLADVVYITPPDADATVDKSGRIRISPPSNTIGPKPSVDRLLLSIAEHYEEHAVGVILSGTGSDGARGIQSMKAAGGITIAQSLKTAKYDSMPHAAIRLGGADIVLAPTEIANQLGLLINEPVVSIIEPHKDNPYSTLEKIIHAISLETGMDFSDYKEATLSRQVARRMTAKSFNSLEDYGSYLENNPAELNELALSFLICVTSFFRDPNAFQALRENLQRLIDSKSPGSEIRIWIPACATGEEAYSMAILLDQMLGSRARHFTIKIFATDINQHAVQTAREGLYPEIALSELSKDVVKTYFSVCDGLYKFDKRLKKQVLFTRHDLIQDPPFLRIDLISCRNLLIYFKPPLQDRVVKIFHYALQNQGILFLGKSETIGKDGSLWQELDRSNKIYRRLGDGNLRHIPLYSTAFGAAVRRQEHTDHADESPQQIGVDMLLKSYAPPSLLATSTGDILHFFGDCSGFVKLRGGKADFNLFSLIDTAFRAELRVGINIASRPNDIYEGMPVRFSINQEDGWYRLVIRQYARMMYENDDVFMVSFEKNVKASLAGIDSKEASDGRSDAYDSAQHISDLEQDLILTREKMQTVIEELETSNEELQALNEETQASSEELQASNEELETANEELQASNEELTTLNEELNNRTVELSQVNNDLENILDSLQKALVVVDQNLQVWRYNKHALHFFELHQQLQPSLISTHTHYEMPRLLQAIHNVLREGAVEEFEFHGKGRYFLTRLTPYREHNTNSKSTTGAVIAIYDITLQKDQEHKLRLSASVFEHASEATLITDEHNTIMAVNPAFTRITGYHEEDVIGKNPSMLSSGLQTKEFYHVMWNTLLSKDSWAGEIKNRRKNGEVYTEYLSINILRNDKGAVYRHIGVFSDVTDAKKVREEVEYQANFDLLTGLPNRNLIQDRIGQVLRVSRRDNHPFTLMFVDLDNFKHINDALGHDMGDSVLQRSARCLSGLLRDSDTVGRMGGDEFVVVLANIGDVEAITLLATRIVNELSQPFIIAGKQIHCSASVGIAVFPIDGDDSTVLLKNADSAMYESKKLGRNRFCFFTRQMQEDAIRRQWMESELLSSLRRKHFVLHYQPIVAMESEQICGVEALIRWNHPTQGMIAPDDFIHIAEQSGLITRLSHWVVSQALADIEAVSEAVGIKLYVSINLSASELVLENHMQQILAMLKASVLVREGRVVIELTERIELVHAGKTQHYLEAMRQLGCKIALDDFGTGYSSISYLKQVCVDAIKVDKSFVHDVTTNASDAATIQAIYHIAQAFDLGLTIEGVEVESQLDFIRQFPGVLVQGHYFSTALPREALQAWILQHR